MKNTIKETAEATRETQEGERGWQLMLVNHSEPQRIGATLPIDGEPISLGRDAGAFGGLHDDRISRRHATIELRGTRIVLTDLGSSNGTHLNERRIDEPEALGAGDLIRVGAVLLLVQRVDARRGRTRHPSLIGGSPAMTEVVEQIERLAPRKTTVLLLGKTGTGKELAARALHDASGRTGPFCAVNCGGMSDQLIESELFGHEQGAFSGAGNRHIGMAEAANGGTLFLDEIGDASASLQSSLLRFLQEGEVRRVGAVHAVNVDVRIVAATHQTLPSPGFREDLYARLARAVVRLPPLADRIEDVPALACKFIADYASSPRSFDWRLMVAVLRHTWPRNVRELEAFVERAVIENEEPEKPLRLTDALRDLLSPAEDAEITRAVPEAADAPTRTRAIRPSNDELRALLEKHEGNVSSVAAELSAGRNTVYRWMKSAGLELADFRPADER